MLVPSLLLGILGCISGSYKEFWGQDEEAATLEAERPAQRDCPCMYIVIRSVQISYFSKSEVCSNFQQLLVSCCKCVCVYTCVHACPEYRIKRPFS